MCKSLCSLLESQLCRNRKCHLPQTVIPPLPPCSNAKQEQENTIFDGWFVAKEPIPTLQGCEFSGGSFQWCMPGRQLSRALAREVDWSTSHHRCSPHKHHATWTEMIVDLHMVHCHEKTHIHRFSIDTTRVLFIASWCDLVCDWLDVQIQLAFVSVSVWGLLPLNWCCYEKCVDLCTPLNIFVLPTEHCSLWLIALETQIFHQPK